MILRIISRNFWVFERHKKNINNINEQHKRLSSNVFVEFLLDIQLYFINFNCKLINSLFNQAWSHWMLIKFLI